MKKYLFTAAIIFAFIGSAQPAIKFKHAMFYIKSQQDTNKFLRDNIIAHKEKYQHKTLNVLCKELGLQVKSYGPIKVFGSHPMMYKGIMLFFENSITNSKRHGSAPSLIVTFEHEIPAGRALGLYSKTFGEWGPEELEFYGNMTIKDIQKNSEK